MKYYITKKFETLIQIVLMGNRLCFSVSIMLELFPYGINNNIGAAGVPEKKK